MKGSGGKGFFNDIETEIIEALILNRIPIDPNIYVAFKRGYERVIEMFQKVEYIGLNSVVLGELYSGFKGDQRKNRT